MIQKALLLNTERNVSSESKSAQHRVRIAITPSLLLGRVPRSHLVRLPRRVRSPEGRIHRVLVARRRVHRRKGMRRGRPAREESR